MLNKLGDWNSEIAKIIKSFFFLFFNFLLIPLVLLVSIFDLFCKVRFVLIRDDRIGHFAWITELFLRRVKLKIINGKQTLFIGIASTNPSNKQLLKMFKRKMKIIQLPLFIWKVINYTFFNERSILIKLKLIFGHFDVKGTEFYEINNSKPILKFTPNEEERGRQLLQKMGLGKDDWFVCFHARDSFFLKKKVGTDIIPAYRNWNIRDALKAMEYIVSKGGFAIRMGSLVEKELKTNNPKIIDYASKFRSDFGDIYLSGKCKLFIGHGSGINWVAEIFNIPVAWVNTIPFEYPPCNKKDIYIPKKFWLIKEKKMLTFAGILKLKLGSTMDTKEYDDAGIKLIENTPQEILDLVIEANERLDGTWKTTEEDEKLQQRFKSLFKKGSPCYGFPSRLGSKFLRENRQLLE